MASITKREECPIACSPTLRELRSARLAWRDDAIVTADCYCRQIVKRSGQCGVRPEPNRKENRLSRLAPRSVPLCLCASVQVVDKLISGRGRTRLQVLAGFGRFLQVVAGGRRWSQWSQVVAGGRGWFLLPPPSLNVLSPHHPSAEPCFLPPCTFHYMYIHAAGELCLCLSLCPSHITITHHPSPIHPRPPKLVQPAKISTLACSLVQAVTSSAIPLCSLSLLGLFFPCLLGRDV